MLAHLPRRRAGLGVAAEAVRLPKPHRIVRPLHRWLLLRKGARHLRRGCRMLCCRLHGNLLAAHHPSTGTFPSSQGSSTRMWCTTDTLDWISSLGMAEWHVAAKWERAADDACKETLTACSCCVMMYVKPVGVRGHGWGLQLPAGFAPLQTPPHSTIGRPCMQQTPAAERRNMCQIKLKLQLLSHERGRTVSNMLTCC